jgi:uncharacterized membrane protein
MPQRYHLQDVLKARILKLMKKRWVIIAIVTLAFLGLADSVYLAEHAKTGAPLLCSIEGLSDCNTVAASPYSRMFGIPVADFGVVFYSLVFIMAALELVLGNRQLRRIIQVLSVIGILVSLYSTIVQKFFIKAFCVYCLASALITLIMLILASQIEPLRRSVSLTKAPVPLPMPPKL